MNIYFHFSVISFSNSYIVGSSKTRAAIIVDPGNLSNDMISRIEENNYEIKAILLTHRNPFFTKAIKTIRKIYNPEIYAYNDQGYDFKVNKVEHGTKIEFDDLKIDCIHIPCSNFDSIVYKIDTAIFTGTTLFSGNIGEKEPAEIRALHLKMLNERILTLEDKTLIFPGYGPTTFLFGEKMFNHDILESMTTYDLLHLSHSSIVMNK